MPLLFPFIRTIRAVIAQSCLVLGAGFGLLLGSVATVHAQGYNPATDPLVQRTINHGEQQSNSNGFSRDHYYEYSENTYSGLLRRPSAKSLTDPAFFPPQPPALAERLAATTTRPPEGDWLPPLVDYPGEIFYMPYAGLLRRYSLSGKRTQRIDQYGATRRQLAGELRAGLDGLKDASAPERAAALAQLAGRQDAPLRALETEAEAIRRDLTAGGLFTVTDDGDELIYLASNRGSRLDEATRDEIALCAAAQYFAGLSTDQRLLLQEMAFDRHDRAVAGGKPGEPSPGPYIYFLPATARIRLPGNLPTALDAKVKALLADKERLKGELRAAVQTKDYFLSRPGAEELTRLAEQQAPQFRVLETLAEEIRAGLAGLPYPDKPDRPAFPEDLARRVDAFGTRKAEVQRELFQHLRTFSTEAPAARLKIARAGDGLAIEPAEPKASVPPALAPVNADLARRYTSLAHEADALRREIQRLNEADPQHGARTVDELATDFARAYGAQENWNRYRDYFRAVLEPGLSAAQRRLLFAATLGDFARAGYRPEP